MINCLSHYSWLVPHTAPTLREIVRDTVALLVWKACRSARPTLRESTCKCLTCTKHQILNTFELNNSLFVRQLKCKCRALILSGNCRINPTRVGAILQGLTQERRSITSWNQVQTFYTSRWATISRLAPVAFCIISLYRVKLDFFWIFRLPYLSGNKVPIMSDIVHTSSGLLIDYSWHHLLRVPVVGRLVACWKWRGRPTKCQLYPLKH